MADKVVDLECLTVRILHFWLIQPLVFWEPKIHHFSLLEVFHTHTHISQWKKKGPQGGISLHMYKEPPEKKNPHIYVNLFFFSNRNVYLTEKKSFGRYQVSFVLNADDNLQC